MSRPWLISAPGRTTARMAALVLCLESLLVFFATLVAFRLSHLPASTVWIGGLGLAVVCLLVSGVVRRPGGMAIGGVVQLLVLATGVVVPAMWVTGAVFVILWLWLGWIGQRIDRSRTPGVPSSEPAP